MLHQAPHDSYHIIFGQAKACKHITGISRHTHTSLHIVYICTIQTLHTFAHYSKIQFFSVSRQYQNKYICRFNNTLVIVLFCNISSKKNTLEYIVIIVNNTLQIAILGYILNEQRFKFIILYCAVQSQYNTVFQYCILLCVLLLAIVQENEIIMKFEHIFHNGFCDKV